MATLVFRVNLLVGLFLSGICVWASSAFPSAQKLQHVAFKRPQLSQVQSSQKSQQLPDEPREQVNTVMVTCHPDSMEIVIKADMFEIGAPVDMDDLRLGVEPSGFCKPTASSGDEYRIMVGLVDCGTKHWMTDDSLVYTNLLIYAPVASPDGLIRMEEAVVPIECHYERRYSLSSSSLTPTWIPYMSTQAAVEALEFNLRLMTDDWLYERGSNVFYLGEPISIEASVTVGHHMGLRVFVSSCVATRQPDINSVPRYVFVENGCLLDSQLPGSKSHFLPRIEDDKLLLVMDAFKFHNEDRAELYITCHLTAVPVNDAQAPNKACIFVNGRWWSADGNDYLCGYCQNQNEAYQTHSKPLRAGKFGPRGFGKLSEPDSLWRSGLKHALWEQEASVGPMVVLPAKHKSGPLPEAELPPLLSKLSGPSLYGSQWRSGVNRVGLEKGLPSTSEPALEEDYEEKVAPGIALKSKSGAAGTNTTAASEVALNVAHSNATATENDPKR
ncbi:zona pellucida sperm-binding protein 3-like [Echeneis naucrates]|uniref:zona pellucida sperm-binding protein 3-like n=1 Tax=Echeneis naucrates TaxID=173247 RepID=UPI001114389A|nr:zona pellucida sperm-binding protein 3-like [Echeneis naucrates]